MPAARLEMIEAQDWYELKSPGLGRYFRDEADIQVKRISAHPLRFPRLLADMHRARPRRFPYGLFFRPMPNTIYVIAGFHFSRDPLIWQNRV
jgi:hypothetical protein